MTGGVQAMWFWLNQRSKVYNYLGVAVMATNTEPKLVPTSIESPLYINRYPPIEKIRFDPMKVSTSKDKDIVPLLSQTRPPTLEGDVEGNITKWFLPVDISGFTDTGFTVVDGKIKVEKHRHPGTMFTCLIDGTLKINGIELVQYDWYLVPPGNEYEIESDTGYRAAFWYLISC